jgi:hypothetical protein
MMSEAAVCRLLIAAVIVAGLTLSTAGLASADPSAGPGPPYIADVHWVHPGHHASLRVYPTRAGRAESVLPGGTAQADEAWSEVLALAPDAATPGMRAQFMCHWDYAEMAEPGKTSWDLEPWRPVVDDQQMIAAGCNPGD